MILASAVALIVGSAPVPASAEVVLSCAWKTGTVEIYRVGGETWQYWDAAERGWFDAPCQLFNQSANITCTDVSDAAAYRYHTVLNDVVQDEAGEVENESRGQAMLTIDRKSGRANSNAGMEIRTAGPDGGDSHHFDNDGLCKAVPDPAMNSDTAP
jgi:hypothetical protein